MCYKLIKRNKNIDEFIASIEQIKQKYNDMVSEKSTTSVAYFEGFSGWYNTRNDNPETEEFFSVVEELLELIGITHIGSEILYTSAYPTENMEKYRADVTPMIIEYINNNLWEDICNSEWENDEV
ncbi:Uncharacterised protein [uncultured archaeon]|nr:Uncharacterised protein [uncultured archaeon]